MKLYYSTGACSLSPNIVLREAGLPFDLVLASTKTHKLQDGTDYYTINSKGYVPLLELDNGERLSEGPVILQKTCPIGPDATLGEVYFNSLFPLGVAALLEAADLVMAGKHQEVAQDESQASYEGWFKAEEARINWANHVDQVYNLIRACNPAPGAWTELAGTRVSIFDCRKHQTRRFADVSGKPGEIVQITETSIFINAQGGQIEVFKLRPDGGKKMGAADFARERQLAATAASSDT